MVSSVNTFSFLGWYSSALVWNVDLILLKASSLSLALSFRLELEATLIDASLLTPRSPCLAPAWSNPSTALRPKKPLLAFAVAHRPIRSDGYFSILVSYYHAKHSTLRVVLCYHFHIQPIGEATFRLLLSSARQQCSRRAFNLLFNSPISLLI